MYNKSLPKLIVILSLFGLFLILPIKSAFAVYNRSTYGSCPYGLDCPAATNDDDDDDDDNNDNRDCTDDVSKDSPPQITSIYANSATVITLKYKDAGDPVESYMLYYGKKAGSDTYRLDYIGKKGSSVFSVPNLDVNTTYYFRIRAVNGCKKGLYSNEVSAKTLGFTNDNKALDVDVSVTPSKDKTANYSDTSKGPIKEDDGIAAQTKEDDYSIKVIVTNDDGSPIVGVKVKIDGDNPQEKLTYTDGSVEFTNLKKRMYEITATYSDQEIKQSVLITGEVKSLDVALKIKQREKTKEENDKTGSNIFYYILGIIAFLILITLFFIIKNSSRKNKSYQ